MHARIRQRRQAVGFNVAFGNAADNLVALRGNLVLLENKLTELQRFVTDDRLPGLVAAAKSCRAIIDLSADNAELAADLAPCAVATITHIRTTMAAMALHAMPIAAHAKDPQ